MLIFNLRSGTLTRVDNLTTATDSESYPTVRVNKYDDWPGTTIVARFVGGEDKDVYDVIVQNDICTVPGEIMTQKAFYISFKGISGSTIITTNQVKIKNAYSGFDLDAEEPATPTPDLITQLINSVAALRSMVGTPLVASTAAGMTDTSKIYVYTGSETGYTAGNWYYYDGSEWQSGGVYNSTAINTDTTLSVSGAAADSKTVGDSIGDLTQLNTTEKTSLVGAINEVASGSTGGDGLTEYQQGLLIAILRNALYSSDQSSNIDALEDSFEVQYTNITLNTNSISLASIGATFQLTATTTPRGGAVTWSSSNLSVATVDSSGLVTSTGYGTATITASIRGLTATCSVTIAQATLVSISATYTQSGSVYDTTPLDDLKADLVVTATWDNSTTSTVPSADYTLSGTLTEGTSTITVSYGGKTTTFNVTVTVVQIVTLRASLEDADNQVFTYLRTKTYTAVYSDDGATDITSSITDGIAALYQNDAVSNDVIMETSITTGDTSYRKLYVGSYDLDNNTVYNAVSYTSGTMSAGTYTKNLTVKAGQRLIFLNMYQNNPYTDTYGKYPLMMATYEEG